MVETTSGPLNGVRVVDLTQFVLGPYATQTLGDLGADVIKIEEPSGDRQRKTGKAPHSKSMGPVYVSLNRNKRSVVLDLKTDDGRAALTALIETADIFIHNMRPQSVAKLGFDYAAVKAIKADIVYVEAIGYAAEGPYAGRQAFDDLIQAASGTAGLPGLTQPGAPLAFIPSVIADKTSGLFAAIAALAALRHKEATGEGQYVAVPMLEAFTGFMMADHLYGETFIPAVGHIGYTGAISPYRKPLPTLDGWIMVMPADPKQAARFMELGGLPGAYESERFVSAQGAPAKVKVYNEMMAEATATRTTADWMALSAEHNIPLMIAHQTQEVLDDPHLKQTLFEQRELEGEGAYRAMKPPLRFSKTPATIRRDPPTLGRDTDDVLRELGIA